MNNVVEVLGSELPLTALDAYYLVIQVTNQVLRKCRLFTIETLAQENPTIEEIGMGLGVICGMLQRYSELEEQSDPTLAEKASEYADYVINISRAINNGDDEELQRLTTALNKRSFL